MFCGYSRDSWAACIWFCGSTRNLAAGDPYTSSTLVLAVTYCHHVMDCIKVVHRFNLMCNIHWRSFMAGFWDEHSTRTPTAEVVRCLARLRRSLADSRGARITRHDARRASLRYRRRLECAWPRLGSVRLGPRSSNRCRRQQIIAPCSIIRGAKLREITVKLRGGEHCVTLSRIIVIIYLCTLEAQWQ